MFALKKSDHTVRNTDVSAETVSALAAAAVKSPQLQLAETNIATLRLRRDELRAEQQALITDDQRGRGTKLSHTRIAALATEIRGIEKQINETRPRVSELRRDRADRINDALLSIQKEAASRVLAAYAEITVATDILIACNEEVRKAGNPDRPHLNHVAGITLIDHARWLLK